MSQTLIARREKAPFSCQTSAVLPLTGFAGYDRPGQVSREHKLSFSNQASSDSPAREEKTTPTPPTQQQPRTHARARMLPQTRGALTRPDALALTRQPVRPSAAAAASQDGIFCRQNLALSRLFLQLALSHNAGLLADSLPPDVSNQGSGFLPPVPSALSSEILRTVGQCFSPATKVRESGSICSTCPGAKRGSGGIGLPTFSPSVTVMRYRSGEEGGPTRFLPSGP